MKQALAILLPALMLLGQEAFGQSYNPENGTIHYPNGTVYGGVNPTNPADDVSSYVIFCPDKNCNSPDLVDCDEDPERCRELLEEAADSAENGNNGGNSGGGNTEGGESEGAENQQFRFLEDQFCLRSKEWSILMKKMKEKPGMYQYRKGDWIYVKNPAMATQKIIAGLRKK